ncbi:unnamed protein product [Acanthoscelides obtectus]|uniref:Uncharacterized protein n=1 Tax=Acanthoscelides obtectus TaxID=200917 RepID=A0A9P0PN69_ACAOB|nr:unnamed protein product [Acanthoscelides obtectus]CAK1646517.1 hypothetical protein AOBTE_LOCUS14682 [Acanthoscelides obtectus]
MRQNQSHQLQRNHYLGDLVKENRQHRLQSLPLLRFNLNRRLLCKRSHRMTSTVSKSLSCLTTRNLKITKTKIKDPLDLEPADMEARSTCPHNRFPEMIHVISASALGVTLFVCSKVVHLQYQGAHPRLLLSEVRVPRRNGNGAESDNVDDNDDHDVTAPFLGTRLQGACYQDWLSNPRQGLQDWRSDQVCFGTLSALHMRWRRSNEM